MNTDIVLSVENLTKYYPGVVALDHVSFDIKRGEIGRASCRERVLIQV